MANEDYGTAGGALWKAIMEALGGTSKVTAGAQPVSADEGEDASTKVPLAGTSPEQPVSPIAAAMGDVPKQAPPAEEPPIMAALGAAPKQAAQSKGVSAYTDILFTEAEKNGVPTDLAQAMMQQESGGNPKARSSAGAMGLMQLMPATAQSLGVTNPWDPVQNISGGMKLMGTLLTKYKGNEALALAAYNAGEGAVDKAGGIPNYPETQNYVKSIQANRGKYGGQSQGTPVDTRMAGNPNNAGMPVPAVAPQDTQQQVPPMQQAMMPQRKRPDFSQNRTLRGWGGNSGPTGLLASWAGYGSDGMTQEERYDMEQQDMDARLGALRGGAGGGVRYGVNAETAVTPDGKTVRLRYGNDGSTIVEPVGYTTVKQQMSDPKHLGDIQKAKQLGKDQAVAAKDIPMINMKVDQIADTVAQLSSHPELANATGIRGQAPAVWGSSRFEFDQLHKQAMGEVFSAAFETLKGGGQITEWEGEKASAALAYINQKLGKEDYVKALQNFQYWMERWRDAKLAQAGKDSPTQTVDDKGGSQMEPAAVSRQSAKSYLDRAAEAQ